MMSDARFARMPFKVDSSTDTAIHVVPDATIFRQHGASMSLA
jgi:hypothetical protein